MIFKQLLEGTDGGDILEVGCGTGQFTEILVDSLASFQSITGVDIVEDVLKKARDKFPGPEFTFRNASSVKLPFDEASFDMAVISKTLHHVEDPEKALVEMCRVLKPGGHLLINEMHRDVLSDQQESHLIYHHLWSEIDDALGISHNHTFKRDDLIRLIAGLGLKGLQTWEFIPDTGSQTREEHELSAGTDADGLDCVRAAVTVRPGTPPDLPALRAHLRRRLPPFMLPHLRVTHLGPDPKPPK